MKTDRLVLKRIAQSDGSLNFYLLAMTKKFNRPPLCNELFPALKRLREAGYYEEVKLQDAPLPVFRITQKGMEFLKEAAASAPT
ncbi:MAG: hypothetical protein ABSE73_06780 [Planctomycetota bacterium]